MREKYEPVIGLEVHVQLLTRDQDFLRLLRRSLARAEYECLSDMPWVAGRFAGAE